MKKQILISLITCICLVTMTSLIYAQKNSGAQAKTKTVDLASLPLPEIAPPDPATATPATEQSSANIYQSALELAATGGQQKNPTYLIAAAQLLLTAGAPVAGTVHPSQSTQVIKIDPAEILKIALELAREQKDKDALMQKLPRCMATQHWG